MISEKKFGFPDKEKNLTYPARTWASRQGKVFYANSSKIKKLAMKGFDDQFNFERRGKVEKLNSAVQYSFDKISVLALF